MSFQDFLKNDDHVLRGQNQYNAPLGNMFAKSMLYFSFSDLESREVFE